MHQNHIFPEFRPPRDPTERAYSAPLDIFAGEEGLAVSPQEPYAVFALISSGLRLQFCSGLLRSRFTD